MTELEPSASLPFASRVQGPLTHVYQRALEVALAEFVLMRHQLLVCACCAQHSGVLHGTEEC